MKKYIFLIIFAQSFSVYAAEMSKEEWISGLTTALAPAFCNSAQYFRQCFSVTAEECEETVVSATQSCLNKYKNDMPAVIVLPKEGAHWGAIVGSCTGETYELTLTKKRVSSDKCDDPSDWM